MRGVRKRALKRMFQEQLPDNELLTTSTWRLFKRLWKQGSLLGPDGRVRWPSARGR